MGNGSIVGEGEINFDMPINEKLDYITVDITSEGNKILPELFVDNNEKILYTFLLRYSLKSRFKYKSLVYVQGKTSQYSII